VYLGDGPPFPVRRTFFAPFCPVCSCRRTEERVRKGRRRLSSPGICSFRVRCSYFDFLALSVSRSPPRPPLAVSSFRKEPEERKSLRRWNKGILFSPHLSPHLDLSPSRPLLAMVRTRTRAARSKIPQPILGLCS
jgi:hypothetical protein